MKGKLSAMKKSTLKKIICSVCALALALSTAITMPSPVYAEGTSAYNWYVMRTKDHTLPKLEAKYGFISKYNAYYGDVSAANSGDKVIYLTFDAGYENGNVERILNTLKKQNVPGAFFILDNLAKRNPELVKRMANEGHLICNHTKSHPDMTKLTDKASFHLQLSALEDSVKESCGVECAKFYRPPEGRFSENNLKMANELGYVTVFWSFAYADWDNDHQPSKEEAIKKILDNAHPGEIMLLHPTSQTNADVLMEVITKLKADGYRFAPLTELIK